MKLSDYVMQFVESKADSIFLLSGGGIMHLVDSVKKSGLKAYCCHHEQAAAIAAEGYARIKNDIGVCLVTTGPGGTNAITGAAGAWLDSIPMMVISGQVKTADITPKRDGKPIQRAIGFQELNVIDLVKPITKYAVTVEDKDEIRYHLEKAYHLATSGRPGPVWIEIPLDIQAAEVDELRPYKVPEPANPEIPIQRVVEELKKAKRPMILAGNGIRLAGAADLFNRIIRKLKANVATVIFTADDIVTSDYPYYLGRQGMWGNRAANYATDNCDLLLVIGDRLQLTQTSWDYDKFASKATKIMVDVDKAELEKETLNIDIPVNCDAKHFLEELEKHDITLNKWDIKIEEIHPDDYKPQGNYLNVFRFFEELSRLNRFDVSTANGMASLATHQAMKIRDGQRIITNAGLGHMGSGLPMAIGAYAARKKPVVCMEGDGSMMLNLQELQTVFHHKMPIRIFIFNNQGYFSIRNTHRNYFNAVFGADSGSGVTLPDYAKISAAFGLDFVRIANDSELDKLNKVMEHDGPVICELMLDPDQKLLEKWMAGTLND